MSKAAASQRSFNPSARSKARRLLLQALYQWEISGDNLTDIEIQYLRDANPKKVDTAYFQALLHAIPGQAQTLQSVFLPFLDRAIAEMDPIELTILRIASYEMTQRQDIPAKVVINEAVELAKVFGAEEGHKYINGVLQQVAQARGLL